MAAVSCVPLCVVTAGVDNYTSFRKLTHGAEDADDFDRVAVSLGFESSKQFRLRDASHQELSAMLRALPSYIYSCYTKSFSEPTSSARTRVVLFLFAGHAQQFKNRRYPSMIGCDETVDGNGVSLDGLVADLNDTIVPGPGRLAFIIILDSCRTNASAGEESCHADPMILRRSKHDFVIIYTCSPGRFAGDGTVRFTASLLPRLQQDGLDLFQAVREAADEVTRHHHGFRRPWLESNCNSRLNLATRRSVGLCGHCGLLRSHIYDTAEFASIGSACTTTRQAFAADREHVDGSASMSVLFGSSRDDTGSESDMQPDCRAGSSTRCSSDPDAPSRPPMSDLRFLANSVFGLGRDILANTPRDSNISAPHLGIREAFGRSATIAIRCLSSRLHHLAVSWCVLLRCPEGCALMFTGVALQCCSVVAGYMLARRSDSHIELAVCLVVAIAVSMMINAHILAVLIEKKHAPPTEFEQILTLDRLRCFMSDPHGANDAFCIVQRPVLLALKRSIADPAVNLGQYLPAVSDIMTLLGMTPGMSLASMVEATQRHWLRTTPQRWGMGRKFLEDASGLERPLRVIGCVGVAWPAEPHHDYWLLIGGTLAHYRIRLAHAIRLWKQGYTCGTLVVTGSSRRVDPLGDDVSQLSVPHYGLEIDSRWSVSSHPCLETEADIAKAVIAQTVLPESMARAFGINIETGSCENASSAACVAAASESRIVFVNAKPSTPGKVPNFADCVKEWLSGPRAPVPGSVLAISAQPFIPQHREVLKNTLPYDFDLQVTGPERLNEKWSVEQLMRDVPGWNTNNLAITLDALARFLFEAASFLRH